MFSGLITFPVPRLDVGKVPHILPAYCRVGAEMQVTQPVVDMVFRKLGGREVLGQQVTSEADLARLVHGRIPLRALIYVRRGGFSDQEIGRFIIPERTQRHRKAKRQPLTVEESDRVVRLTRIQALTEDVFGDAQKANRWLRENLAILDGKPPLEIARTESGARVVEQMLAKIDWGAAA
jgi:putative toxin-antitoxin system antitoxin component (TIGR02293 family)